MNGHAKFVRREGGLYRLSPAFPAETAEIEMKYDERRNNIAVYINPAQRLLDPTAPTLDSTATEAQPKAATRVQQRPETDMPKHSPLRTSSSTPSPSTPLPQPATDPPPKQPTPDDQLAQLVQTIANVDGAVKDAKEARKHLIATGCIEKDDEITLRKIANILLTLVTTAPKRGSSDRIPERAVNIIKATALTIVEITANTPATEANTSNAPLNPQLSVTPLDNLHKQLETNINFLKVAASSQAEATEKANALLGKLERICNQAESTAKEIEQSAKTAATSATTYRDALINGKTPDPPSTPQSFNQRKAMNRVNIMACQLMVEYEGKGQEKLTRICPQGISHGQFIKEQVTNRLKPAEDSNGPLPNNAFVRLVNTYENFRALIEMNSAESADWMKTYPNRILGDILGCEIKIVGRVYPVVARFMPITFEITQDAIRQIEKDASLPPNSIQEATWIKDPTKRLNSQKYANIKFLCTTPQTANKMISGPVYGAGSRLAIHKDIRLPGVCNKCQRYGHVARNCHENTDTCGICGEEHRTSTCNNSQIRKCTPCGSTNHPTNSVDCPIYRQREQAMADKDPEAVSPFYLTSDIWTWGPHNETDHPIPPPPGLTRLRQKTKPGAPLTGANSIQRQQTLYDNGFQRQTPAHLQSLPPQPEPQPQPHPQSRPRPQPQPRPQPRTQPPVHAQPPAQTQSQPSHPSDPPIPAAQQSLDNDANEGTPPPSAQ